ncbi:DUF6891 domain-containing protein [Gordonia sp. NPDC003424]
MPEELLTELHEFVRARLIPGFVGLPDIESDVRDWAEDTGSAPEEALTETRRLWAQRAAQARSWTDTGDYGRLRAAFDELDAAGVLARMNFACCATCANQEIDDERTDDPDPADWYPYREWAYVYFHEQDAERLADDDPVLWLGFSAFRPHPRLPVSLLDAMSEGDQAAEREVYDRTETLVGTQVVEVLRRHGLDVDWSGSRHERIAVAIHSWQKPLPLSLAG